MTRRMVLRLLGLAALVGPRPFPAPVPPPIAPVPPLPTWSTINPIFSEVVAFRWLTVDEMRARYPHAPEELFKDGGPAGMPPWQHIIRVDEADVEVPGRA